MPRWARANCIPSGFGITNFLCMRALTRTATHKGGLLRQKRWNKGDPSDWKLLFLHLRFCVFKSFSDLRWYWQELTAHTVLLPAESCSCSLDMKGGETRTQLVFFKRNICKDNRFELVEINPFFPVEMIPPHPPVIHEKRITDFLSLPPSFLARTKKTWVDTIFIVMLGWVSDLALAYWMSNWIRGLC